MNQLLEKIKKYYMYIIFAIIIIVLFISILFMVPTNHEEQVQIPEVKLEQNYEDIVSEKVKIDIKGNIANPGVYELEKGSRVIDAINLAGGLLEDSNTDLINLSGQLTDEMVIIIYTNEQIEKYQNDNKKIEYVYIEVPACPDQINDACINKKASDSSETSKEQSNVEQKAEKISLNQATIQDLTNLSGIGEKKAKDIIDYRNENGLFESIEDIKNVSGIGEALFEKIKDFITI